MNFLHAVREQELHAILPFLRQDARILEIGGGTGLQARILSEKGYNITSIDVEHSNYAEQRLFSVLNYDGINIPFPDGSFDIIISSSTLEHIPNLIPFLEETARVLAPAGTCVHVLPSATWSVSTFAGHYITLMEAIVRDIPILIPRKMDITEARRILNHFRNILYTYIPRCLPQRHGERGCVLAEPFIFSRLAWKYVFSRAHFSIKTVRPMRLFYTGNMLLGHRLSLRARSILAHIFGSATVLFEVTPSATPATKKISPPDFSAIAEHVRPFSMVPAPAIAFAAEHVVRVIEHNIPGIIDDYFTWDGCARAVHDYLSRNDLPYRIESLPNHMGAFFVKKSQRLTFDDIRESWKRS